MGLRAEGVYREFPLNESPSEKEGKSGRSLCFPYIYSPSMKVPPKRKGNQNQFGPKTKTDIPLNESPSKKEGKFFGST